MEDIRTDVLVHQVLDDLSEIIAECELLLPMITPIYPITKRVRNIRRIAGDLAGNVGTQVGCKARVS